MQARCLGVLSGSGYVQIGLTVSIFVKTLFVRISVFCPRCRSLFALLDEFFGGCSDLLHWMDRASGDCIRLRNRSHCSCQWCWRRSSIRKRSPTTSRYNSGRTKNQGIPNIGGGPGASPSTTKFQRSGNNTITYPVSHRKNIDPFALYKVC